jgi:peptide/nickel transport system substrate-binding protein
MSHTPFIDLEPARVYEFEGGFVLEQTYDCLVDFVGGAEAFQEIKPGLATSWERSPDGLTWTFHLRQGAKFHSGNEVTADAVVFSFHRSLALNFAPIWIISQFMPEPDMIRKVDDYTVAITTNQPIGEMLMAAVLGYQGIGSIVDPTVVEAHATSDDPWANQWLKEHDAGSGPFVLREWAREDRIVLEAFSDYWRGKPALDQVIIQNIPEPTAQMFSLLRGDIDVAWNLLPDQIAELKGQPGLKFIETPTFTYYYAGMNMGYGPFADEKVRDAVRYAIDYDAIVRGILRGAATPCHTFVPAGMFSHSDLLYRQDLEKAHELLIQAGYPDGFEVELLTRTDPPFTDIAVQIQQDLAKVGIRVKVTQMIYAQLLEIYRTQKHQMVLVRWGTDYADPSANAAPFGHCDTPGPEAKVQQLAWRNMYCPSGVTDWVEQAAGEPDSRKREIMYKAIQAVVWDEGPYVFLVNPVFQVAIRENVQGLQIPPMWYYTDLSLVYK